METPPSFRLMRRVLAVLAAACVSVSFARPTRAAVVFETFSAYHHILVVDEGGTRTLSFDGSMETRMSLSDPLRGHFRYTEQFHHAWLWNTNLARVLMLGLGGGSTQRSFLHRYPEVRVDSVEIDPAVVTIAADYFATTASERHRIHVEDGRGFLRRSRDRWDLIILDAYVKHRYGSHMPPHLATREFFEIARDHLGTNGVLAYNVISVVKAGGTDAPRALTRTLLEVFPQVYWFPVTDSANVVLIATREPRRIPASELKRRAVELEGRGLQPPDGLWSRLATAKTDPPASVRQAPVLTDDHAPVEALQRRTR